MNMMLSLNNTSYCIMSILSDQLVPFFVDELDTPLIFFKGKLYSYSMSLYKIINSGNNPTPTMVSSQLELFRRLKMEGLIDINNNDIANAYNFLRYHCPIFFKPSCGGGWLSDPDLRLETLKGCSYDTIPHLSLKDLLSV